MSQWFHRNQYKATGRPIFDLGPVAKSIDARNVCSQAADRRLRLLTLFADPNTDPGTMLETANMYFKLLMGFVDCQDEDPSSFPMDDSNDSEKEDETVRHGAGEAKKKKKKEKRPTVPPSLRKIISYTWSNSLDVKHINTMSIYDAYFELFGMLFNLALWYMKHAAKVAANEQINQEAALDVFKSLRYAAGIFSHLKDNVLGKINCQQSNGSDMDSTLLDVYIHQCLAEAQEVTIARAIEGKHKPSLIAALAWETSVIYDKCKLGLLGLPDEQVFKWRTYLIFKASCFRAYAYCYHAEGLLEEHKCGVAIACAKEAIKHCDEAGRAANAYSSKSGAGHCFFRKLRPFADRVLSKANSENAMIYHQSAPASAPPLNLKADFGIATTDMPDISFVKDEMWASAVPGFDTVNLMEFLGGKDAQKKQKEASKVQPIKEAPIYQSDRDQNNASGCVVA